MVEPAWDDDFKGLMTQANEEHDLHERLEKLEHIFLLIDWDKFEQAAKLKLQVGAELEPSLADNKAYNDDDEKTHFAGGAGPDTSAKDVVMQDEILEYLRTWRDEVRNGTWRSNFNDTEDRLIPMAPT